MAAEEEKKTAQPQPEPAAAEEAAKTAGEPAAQEAEAASAAEAEEAEVTKRKKKQDDDLQQKLEEAVKETQKLKDQLLRTAAEYDNFRKRSDREKKAIYADATADAVSGLLGFSWSPTTSSVRSRRRTARWRISARGLTWCRTKCAAPSGN